MVEPIQFIAWIGYLLYALLVYKSETGKKVLALIMVSFVQISSELFLYIPGSILAGEFSLMSVESNFTIIVVLIQIPIEFAGIYLLIRLWKWIEQIEWKTNYQIWLCLVYPLSQICYLIHVALYYSINSRTVPGLVFVGFFLGVAADIYIFILFVWLNRREKAEKELIKLRAQYELEQLRYEELMKTEEEMKQIRHDIQNYCITIKNMWGEENEGCSV